MTEFWFIRHTSVDVPAGFCYGRSDVALRSTFADEAAVVRRHLEGATFDSVWCSPLSRCRKLARTCGYGDATCDERLTEIDFGAWEGLMFDAIDDPQLQRWYNNYLHERPTGGETFDEQRHRVAAFIDEVRRVCHRRVLVFTHGGVILAAGIHAGLFRPDEAFSHLTPYGGVVKINM